jgi:hypothetical protein
MYLKVQFPPEIYFDHMTLVQDISLTTYYFEKPQEKYDVTCSEGDIRVDFFKERKARIAHGKLQPSVLSVAVKFGPSCTIAVGLAPDGKYVATVQKIEDVVIGFFQKR